MKSSVYWAMALAAGVVVSNNYYNQPLLLDFAREFQTTEQQAGFVSVASQAGYALGLLLLVPLGDMIRRHRIFMATLTAATVSLAATAVAPSLAWLIVTSFLASFTSVTPQLLTPLAARLAGPQARGTAVSIVMLGLLTGILLSRTVSGTIAAYWGWRNVYWVAAVATFAILCVLVALIPRAEPTYKGTYRDLMSSLWTLLRNEPLLRNTSCITGFQFAAFCAFWATLTFHLHGLDSRYGSAIAGLFGLIGVVGAAASTWAGKVTDKGGAGAVSLASSFVLVAAFAVFAIAGNTIAGLILGVILLDFGSQAGHVANMARNMGINPAAMNRTNTLYMTVRFIGGAAGTAIGTYAWSLWQWNGVCAAGLLLGLASLGTQLWTETFGRARQRAPSPYGAEEGTNPGD